MTTVQQSSENVKRKFDTNSSYPSNENYLEEVPHLQMESLNFFPTMESEHYGPQPQPLTHGCDDSWSWSRRDKSHEVYLFGDDFKIAHFHPNWSSGTAGIRGTRVLNNGKYFWELHLAQRIFGTSMMFGIATKQARLHADSFTNLIGEDVNGWGLSHKGLLWHGGAWYNYTKPFRENEETTIGILFDGVNGTLTYYKDGICLGIAFRGLNEIKENMYPMVCSTAAKTEMTLGTIKRDFVNLQDRCRAIITKAVKDKDEIDKLYIPSTIKEYLAEVFSTESDSQPLHPCTVFYDINEEMRYPVCN